MICLETLKFDSMSIHHLQGHIESMYLVQYPHKLLLLDCGCRCDAGEIRSYIRHTLKRDVSQLKLCVVTHLHPDHAGGSQSLRAHTNTEIAAFKNIDRWYAGLGGFLQHKIDTYLAWWVSRKQGNQKRRVHYARLVNPDCSLDDEQTLPGFEDWTVLHTPGHTSHDICLYHRDSNVLYVGDLLVKIKEKYLPPFPVTLKVQMQNSYTRLEAIDPKILLLAHGGPMDPACFPNFYRILSDKIGKQQKMKFKMVGIVSYFSSELRKMKKRKLDYHK
ncbi:MAG: Zn-dependent hydrolase [Acidobacteria bacterium]|nr:MAG: Zn-dependent hydrolase [Acidobacteriota bacterium]